MALVRPSVSQLLCAFLALGTGFFAETAGRKHEEMEISTGGTPIYGWFTMEHTSKMDENWGYHGVPPWNGSAWSSMIILCCCILDRRIGRNWSPSCWVPWDYEAAHIRAAPSRCLMIHGDSWSFMVIHSHSWWFMVIPSSHRLLFSQVHRQRSPERFVRRSKKADRNWRLDLGVCWTAWLFSPNWSRSKDLERECFARLCSAWQYDYMMQYDTIWCNMMQYDAMLFNAIWYNLIQYDMPN